VEIIDAQMHEVHPIVWPFPDETLHPVSTELTREAMDCVGVDASLLHAPLEFCEYAIDTYPDRFAACIKVLPGDDDPLSTLGELQARPGILAIRTVIIDWYNTVLTTEYLSGAFDPIYAAAQKLDLPVFVFATGQVGAVADIACAYPELQLIVDHIGLPQPTPMLIPDDPWQDMPIVNSLAQYPNVSVKFSGAQSLSSEPYPHRDVWPHLHPMIEAFTPDRLMWGADMTRLRFKHRTIEPGTREGWAGLYSDSLNYVRDTDELSASNKEAIFSTTIRRTLGWSRPASV